MDNDLEVHAHFVVQQGLGIASNTICFVHLGRFRLAEIYFIISNSPAHIYTDLLTKNRKIKSQCFRVTLGRERLGELSCSAFVLVAFLGSIQSHECLLCGEHPSGNKTR